MKIAIVDKKAERGLYTSPMSVYEVVKNIIPDCTGDTWNVRHNGVRFSGIHADYMFRKTRLLGITIEADKTRHRVMVKDGFIDGDALKVKYEELVIVAKDAAEAYAKSQDRARQIGEMEQRIIEEVGLPPKDYGWRNGIRGISPDTVEIVTAPGGVPWQAIKGVSEILGQEVLVSLRIIVPADKAVAVYRIMRPEVTK